MYHMNGVRISTNLLYEFLEISPREISEMNMYVFYAFRAHTDGGFWMYAIYIGTY